MSVIEWGENIVILLINQIKKPIESQGAAVNELFLLQWQKKKVKF